MDEATKKLVIEAGKEAVKEILSEIETQFEPLADKYRKYGTAYAKKAASIAASIVTGKTDYEDGKEQLDDLLQATQLRLVQAALEAKSKEVELIHRSLMILLKVVSSIALA